MLTKTSIIYRFSRNMQPDDNMSDDVRDLLTGIIVSVKDHKTGIKGPAEVWLSPTDQILIQALMEVNQRYASQKNLEYPQTSPIFVNKFMTPYKTNISHSKRPIDYSRFARIAGVKQFRSHDTRHMWTDSLSNQTSLILREAYALSANHSVATQQKTYVSNFLNTIKKVCKFVDL